MKPRKKRLAATSLNSPLSTPEKILRSGRPCVVQTPPKTPASCELKDSSESASSNIRAQSDSGPSESSDPESEAVTVTKVPLRVKREHCCSRRDAIIVRHPRSRKLQSPSPSDFDETKRRTRTVKAAAKKLCPVTPELQRKKLTRKRFKKFSSSTREASKSDASRSSENSDATSSKDSPVQKRRRRYAAVDFSRRKKIPEKSSDGTGFKDSDPGEHEYDCGNGLPQTPKRSRAELRMDVFRTSKVTNKILQHTVRKIPRCCDSDSDASSTSMAASESSTENKRRNPCDVKKWLNTSLDSDDSTSSVGAKRLPVVTRSHKLLRWPVAASTLKSPRTARRPKVSPRSPVLAARKSPRTPTRGKKLVVPLAPSSPDTKSRFMTFSKPIQRIVNDFKWKAIQQPGVPCYLSYREPRFLNDMLLKVQKDFPDVKKRDFYHWVREHDWITDEWKMGPKWLEDAKEANLLAFRKARKLFEESDEEDGEFRFAKAENSQIGENSDADERTENGKVINGSGFGQVECYTENRQPQHTGDDQNSNEEIDLSLSDESENNDGGSWEAGKRMCSDFLIPAVSEVDIIQNPNTSTTQELGFPACARYIDGTVQTFKSLTDLDSLESGQHANNLNTTGGDASLPAEGNERPAELNESFSSNDVVTSKDDHVPEPVIKTEPTSESDSDSSMYEPLLIDFLLDHDVNVSLDDFITASREFFESGALNKEPLPNLTLTESSFEEYEVLDIPGLLKEGLEVTDSPVSVDPLSALQTTSNLIDCVPEASGEVSIDPETPLGSSLETGSGDSAKGPSPEARLQPQLKNLTEDQRIEQIESMCRCYRNLEIAIQDVERLAQLSNNAPQWVDSIADSRKIQQNLMKQIQELSVLPLEKFN